MLASVFASIVPAVLGCASPGERQGLDTPARAPAQLPSDALADEQSEPWGRGALPDSPPRAVGGLRQVQLLSVEPVTDDEPGRVRFATAMRVGNVSRVAVYDLPLATGRGPEEALQLRDPAMALDVEYDLFPYWTWESRSHWKVLELGDALLLAVFDSAGHRVELREFGSGRLLLEMDGCASFEDARVDDGIARILIGTGTGVRTITWNAREEVTSSQDIAVHDLAGTVAAFVAAPFGEPWSREIAVAGCRDRHLVVELRSLDGDEVHTTSVGLSLPDATRLRVAAWAGDGMRRVAVGLPETLNWGGCVALVQLDDDVPPGLVHHILPQRMSAGDLASGIWFTSHFQFGQALCFTADLDGDDLPELAIGAPDGLGDLHVDVVSHADGWTLRKVGSFLFRVGVSVTVDPTGRYLLTGGGYVDRPESLTNEARAVLHDLTPGAGLLATYDFKVWYPWGRRDPRPVN